MRDNDESSRGKKFIVHCAELTVETFFHARELILKCICVSVFKLLHFNFNKITLKLRLAEGMIINLKKIQFNFIKNSELWTWIFSPLSNQFLSLSAPEWLKYANYLLNYHRDLFKYIRSPYFLHARVALWKSRNPNCKKIYFHQQNNNNKQTS